MENFFDAENDWKTLTSAFPSDWRELAKTTGARVRSFRSLDSDETSLRAIMMHVVGGCSFREVSARLKIANIASMSDVALFKRFKRSAGWLKALCYSILNQKQAKENLEDQEIRMRLVDGTIVIEPGNLGGRWRIHYSFAIPQLECDYLKISPYTGEGNGESLTQYPIQPGDCVIGDRVFSTAPGISHVDECGGYSLVRVNSSALNFYSMDKKAFDLVSEFKTLVSADQSDEWDVLINDGNRYISGRVCVKRKSDAAIEKTIVKLKKAASKRQRTVKPKTLEFAKYIVTFTTLPKEKYPLQKVLELYRNRWQVELAFKRLKSLLHLGHLPSQDAESAQAWIYGKLFAGLLTEKLLAAANSLLPIQSVGKKNPKRVARIPIHV